MNEEQKSFEGFNIKVTNHLNGEITELKIKGADQAEQVFFQLQASDRAIKSAMDQLVFYLDKWLGVDEKHQFADGRQIQRVQRETRTWTIEGLKAVGLDADALEVMTKVNMTTAKTVIDEMIERGDIKPDAKKELNASADVSVTKPYITMR